MNNYVEQLYKDIDDNRYDLDALLLMEKAIDKHEEDLCKLYCVVKDRIKVLIDYEETFNPSTKDRQIIQYDAEWNEIRLFSSIKEASRGLNILDKSISNVVNWRAKSCWGFTFKAKDSKEEQYFEENYFNNN